MMGGGGCARCNRIDGFHFTISALTEINTRHCDGCNVMEVEHEFFCNLYFLLQDRTNIIVSSIPTANFSWRTNFLRNN
jgi:hypothetical protein